MTTTSSPASAEPPMLPPQGFLVDFNLLPTKKKDGSPTVRLFAAYRIPGDMALAYGAKVNDAAFIAAIDRKTGDVYVADGSKMHGIPLDMQAYANAAPPSKNSPAVVAAEGDFLIDLPGQIGLPADGGEFAVFVWIDSLISRVKTIKVPPDPKRNGKPRFAPRPAQLGAVSLDKKSKTPKPASGAIVLEPSPEEMPFGIGHIYAVVGASVYPKDAQAPVAVVFASDWLTRDVVAQCIQLPANPAPQAGFPLDYEAGALFMGGLDRRKVFTFVVADLQASPVVVLEPKR